MPSKSKSFIFKISDISAYEGTPTHRHFENELDYSADLVSIERMPNESNADFKQRVLDVNVHPGGPTETRVINGLARDLGFLRELALTIDVVKDANGDPTAASPRVLFLANRVILYSDWRPDGTAVVDKEIRFYQPDDDGFYLNDLVDEINSSTYFTATINGDIRSNLHSFLLIREDSLNVIFSDFIDSKKKNDLVGSYLVKDGIFFGAESVDLQEEVTFDPSSSGEYLIDYTSGSITTYEDVAVENTVTYYHNIFPLKIDYTPIQVFSLGDDNFVDELFVQETLQSGEDTKTLPNTEGSEIYHQLFKETNNLWGK